MKNILSIDLESWIHFYIDIFGESGKYTSAEKKRLDNGYICDAVKRLIKLLKKNNQTATFFVISEIYDWYPDIIEEISRNGHEIAYHSHDHPVLSSPEILENQLLQSQRFLENYKPIGFRAPHINITASSLACLKNYGFVYSSSTYDSLGKHSINGIDEIPVSAVAFRKDNVSPEILPKKLTVGLLIKKIPFGSGFFIAILGPKITSYFINYLNRRGTPAVLFVHPWQLYKDSSLSGVSFLLKVLRRNPMFAPYTKIILPDFEKLLKQYKFNSFKEYFYE